MPAKRILHVRQFRKPEIGIRNRNSLRRIQTTRADDPAVHQLIPYRHRILHAIGPCQKIHETRQLPHIVRVARIRRRCGQRLGKRIQSRVHSVRRDQKLQILNRSLTRLGNQTEDLARGTLVIC